MTRRELADLILRSEEHSVSEVFRSRAGREYRIHLFVPEPVPEKELKFEPSDER